MAASTWIRGRVEQIIYVVAGLPIAIHGSGSAATPASKEMLEAFGHAYWHPETILETTELAIGIAVAPVVVLAAALWFTLRNGPTIRQQHGKGLVAQFAEELRLYASAGILAPWYYILSLHRDGERRAPTFLQRFETKRGVFRLLREGASSPLGDKIAFAKACAFAGVRCVPCELVVDHETASGTGVPDCDLFVKPRTGRGGRGAERWDRVAPRRWASANHHYNESELIGHLAAKAQPMIVQRRLRPHHSLGRITSGALPTVRALTMTNERGSPELLAAVFRMSLGTNRTVDNIHAGGLACGVSLDRGVLGPASNLGSDARFGWCSIHPTTGVRIEGTRLPYWRETCALALEAQAAFPDRVMIGWDVAILEDGPIIVEGNRGPDMDLMQRFMDTGFLTQRLGDLVAWHLKSRRIAPTPLAGARPLS